VTLLIQLTRLSLCNYLSNIKLIKIYLHKKASELSSLLSLLKPTKIVTILPLNELLSSKRLLIYLFNTKLQNIKRKWPFLDLKAKRYPSLAAISPLAA